MRTGGGDAWWSGTAVNRQQGALVSGPRNSSCQVQAEMPTRAQQAPVRTHQLAADAKAPLSRDGALLLRVVAQQVVVAQQRSVQQALGGGGGKRWGRCW